MKQSSLKRNFIFNLLYQVFSIITPIITTPYISRVLSADGIGKYSYALSIVTYFGLFGTLGITTYGQLEIAKRRDNQIELHHIISEIVIARLITMSISMVLYGVVIWFSKEHKLMHIILILYLLGQMNDISFVFQGLENFKILAIRNIIIKIISISIIFLCIQHHDDIYLYVFVIQGTTFIGNFCLWPQVWKYIKPINWKNLCIIKHWKNSIVYFIPTIATTVYTVLDKSMIGWITQSEFQNGYYEQAHKIEQLLLVIVTAIGTVTLPRMAYLFEIKDEDAIHHIMELTIKIIFFLSIPMTFGLSAIADILIPCFLGEGYDTCVSLIRVFSPLIIIVGLDNVIGKQCLISTGRQKQFNFGVIGGAILNFFMNIYLIPKFQSLGAAISSVCAELLILIIFIIISREYLHIDNIWHIILEYIMVSMIMAIIVWIIGHSLGISPCTLIIQVITGIIIYTMGLLIIQDKFLFAIILKIKSKNYQ